MSSPRCRTLLAASLLLAAAGCASLEPDAGFAEVQRTGQSQLGLTLTWPRTPAEREARDRQVASLLAAPLDREAATQVALLNNRALQAGYAQLGLAEAGRVQAARLPNPGFSFSRLRRGDEVELERGVHIDLLRVLLMPWTAPAAERQQQVARREAAQQALALAADTRKAWVHAVAADEAVRFARQVQDAADASAELARRMAQVGNFNALQRAREQRFYADAALQLARAEQQRIAARERLTRLMGLWGEQLDFRLPERLPDLPTAPRELPQAETLAMAQRLDVQAARLAVEQTARNLGLTQATRWVNVLEFGLARNSSNEAPVQRGWEVSLELPLFDFGGARVARAEAMYVREFENAAAVAVQARSEVREAYLGYRHAFDIARHHRDEIVPLARRIADENLLRYNGMLIGVFELLADARSQVAAVNASIEALRDFWIADADLQMALIGKPGLTPPAGSGPAASVEPAGGH